MGLPGRDASVQCTNTPRTRKSMHRRTGHFDERYRGLELYNCSCDLCVFRLCRVNGLMEQRRPPCVILQYPFAHSLHTWLVGARGSLFLVDSARRRLLHRARKRERRLLVRSVAAARAAEAVRTTGHDKSHGDDDDDQPPRVPRLADLQREALDDFAAHRVPEHEAPDMWDFAAHHLRAEIRWREVRLRQLDERTADVGRSAGRNAQQACRRSACTPLSRLNPACVQQRVN